MAFSHANVYYFRIFDIIYQVGNFYLILKIEPETPAGFQRLKGNRIIVKITTFLVQEPDKEP